MPNSVKLKNRRSAQICPPRGTTAKSLAFLHKDTAGATIYRARSRRRSIHFPAGQKDGQRHPHSPPARPASSQPLQGGLFRQAHASHLLRTQKKLYFSMPYISLGRLCTASGGASPLPHRHWYGKDARHCTTLSADKVSPTRQPKRQSPVPISPDQWSKNHGQL